MKEKYWGKVILFGEYSMIFDSTALVIPMKRFGACWKQDGGGQDEFLRWSSGELTRFCEYLREGESFAGEIDIEAFAHDLRNGWALSSDIPPGYGLGSSGSVVAAVYDRYARSRIRNDLRLKELFSRMEGFFHGSSSGIDPLQCYLGKPFRITPDSLELLADGFPRSGIRIFLIDTKEKSSTKPLVDYFRKQRESDAFMTGFQRDYLPCVRACMDTVIGGDHDGFFKALRELTRKPLRFFRPMIPDGMLPLFEREYDFNFGVKILGSGGGGYMLGFTDDGQRATELLRGGDVLWLNTETS